MKKLLSAVLAAVMLGTTGYAAVKDMGDMKVSIDESTEKANALMNVEIWGPNKNIDDLSNETSAQNILVYKKDLTTDDNGKITLDIEIGGDARLSGIYTLEISGENYHTTEEFLLTNKEKTNLLIAEINKVISDKTAEEAKEFLAQKISDNTFDLCIVSAAYIDDETAARAAELVYNYLNDKKITLAEDNVSFVMNKSVAIAATEYKQVSNVIKDSDLFVLSQSEIKDYYQKKYVGDYTGTSMAARLNGRKYKNFAEFDDALTEAFVLSVIEKPDGVDNVKEIMQAFSGKIGTGSSGTESRYSHVSGNKYASYAELKTAFDSFSGRGSETSGSSGGSSSGGSNRGTTTIGGQYTEPVTPDTYPMTIFDDISTVPWAEEAIVTLAEKRIINGVGDNKFAPNDYITREEFATIVVNAFLEKQPLAEIKFADVKDGEWYYEKIQKAYGAGVVNGISDDMFGIGRNITRQDMTVMLYRIGKYVGGYFDDTTETAEKFSDDSEISDYASEAVYALKAREIVNGVDEYNFAPLNTATRAEAAKMIYGMIK